ncbi:DUF3419 family protein [Fodinibius sediminis]|uniref:S-adenosylmethionine:diacylglycerol 3-amino-3-carboxypropyl transferase n=1 Tax=Fodinibius sediminis TaxID=1214077 RepID=A0A521BDY9_9BACT|nr:DUF3419 family protein [Fodinibius sediminis]SMO45328.1 S-adenosylmethionine:diacylglycerol 3-amino-3-carboxypropyl transferase [Fodinibius sediminis]
MVKRSYLYDFGISQDDPQTELRVLDLVPGDRLLCIASGGEVPLELLVNSPSSVTIDAVDIAEPQLFLSNLKLNAAIELDGHDAARFLGYLRADNSRREIWFEQIRKRLPDREVHFWEQHSAVFDRGPVHLGRFETYIARFAPLGRWLLGSRRDIRGLFETRTIEDQKEYFDRKFRVGLLKKLFRIMFSKRLYKSHGIAEQGLIHMDEQEQDISRIFYHRFRRFCTNTPVRENWLLQFVLFDRVLFEEALPSYLGEAGRKRLCLEKDRLRFSNKSYTDMISHHSSRTYNKFALSNVSDWLSTDAFSGLLRLIAEKTGAGARGLIRYIHSADTEDPRLQGRIKFDRVWGEELLCRDRFPFYNLIPFEVRGKNDE